MYYRTLIWFGFEDDGLYPEAIKKKHSTEWNFKMVLKCWNRKVKVLKPDFLNYVNYEAIVFSDVCEHSREEL